MKIIIIIFLIGLGIFFFNKFMSRFKFPKIPSMCVITGGVKVGKSTFGVGLADKEYKRVHRSWKIRKFFQKLFGKSISEEPLLYSNIPLSIPYAPLTKDLILRKKRFRYGSVIYVNEASLLADSQLIKDLDLNDRLLLFNKLIGHETKGGCIIYDTQTIADCHYSIKRCLSDYFYIHSLVKWIPFFLVAKVIECRYSEDNSVLSVDTQDVELNTRRVIMRKSVWKKFDAYCYSSFTDDLPIEDKVIYYADSLKSNDIISFRDRPLLHKNKKTEVIRVNEKKDN